VDNEADQEIHFRCTLRDPVTNALSSVTLVFCYQRGVGPDAIQYSRHNAEYGAQVTGGTGFIGNVLDPIAGQVRLTRTTAYAFGGITIGQYQYQRRLNDPALYTDNIPGSGGDENVAIASVYEHAPLPTDNWVPLKFNGIQMAISTPSGTVNPSVKDKGGTRTINLAPISGESASPQASQTRMFSMQSEGLRARIDGIGGWILHKLEVFNGGPLSFRR